MYAARRTLHRFVRVKESCSGEGDNAYPTLQLHGKQKNQTQRHLGQTHRRSAPGAAHSDVGLGSVFKLSKDLQAATSTNVDVVIQYYTPPTSVDTNAATSQGASNGKAVGLVRGYKWTMPKGNVSTLISKDPNIKYISLYRKLQGALDNAVPAVGADNARGS